MPNMGLHQNVRQRGLTVRAGDTSAEPRAATVRAGDSSAEATRCHSEDRRQLCRRDSDTGRARCGGSDGYDSGGRRGNGQGDDSM